MGRKRTRHYCTTQIILTLIENAAILHWALFIKKNTRTGIASLFIILFIKQQFQNTSVTEVIAFDDLAFTIKSLLNSDKRQLSFQLKGAFFLI